MKLSDAITDYINDHELRNSSEHTLKAIKRVLGKLSEELGDSEVESMTTTDLRAYLKDLKTTPKNKGYHLDWVKALFSWLTNEGRIPYSPATTIKAPKTEKKVLDALADEEVKEVVRTAKTLRDKALIRVGLETGLRLSELLSLKVGSFDNEGRAVVLGKGKKERIVCVSKDTLERLRKYEATVGEGQLWKCRDGSDISDDGLRQAIKTLGEKANIELTPHKLRRTMAIRRLRAGCDLHTLASMMGHADISILRQYLPFVSADLENAWGKFKVL